MADRPTKNEYNLRDFVESDTPGFGPGSYASEKILQEDSDQAAERFKTAKGAKQAIRRSKAKDIGKKFVSIMKHPPILTGTAGALKAAQNYFGSSGDSDRLTDREVTNLGSEGARLFKHGGSVMSRGCKMGRNKPTKLY